MSQSSPPNQAGNSGGRGSGTAAVVGLALVALLSLGFAGYMALNPHTVTVTEQQVVTNTQNLYSVQTQTVTFSNTMTSATTITATPPTGYGYGPGSYQMCNYYYYYYYGCNQSPGYYYYYPGYYYGYANYQPCQYTGSGSSVTCSGYLYEANNGCTLLVVPASNNPYPSYATTNVYEYYALHNLPSNTPSTGTWVTVSGVLYQGGNTASNGASCPTNYIIVNSKS